MATSTVTEENAGPEEVRAPCLLGQSTHVPEDDGSEQQSPKSKLHGGGWARRAGVGANAAREEPQVDGTVLPKWKKEGSPPPRCCNSECPPQYPSALLTHLHPLPCSQPELSDPSQETHRDWEDGVSVSSLHFKKRSGKKKLGMQVANKQ